MKEADYVAGFLFSEDLKNVALIEKKRPDWQRGKLNGIGGHIEDSDKHPLFAMIREFKEETGVINRNWKPYARISIKDTSVIFYWSIGDLTKLRTVTDEEIKIININDIFLYNTIENLPWLIPLAIDSINDGRPEWTEVTYPTTRN